jgi:transposase
VNKSNILKWHKHFREGREDVNKNEKQGAPITKQMAKNFAKIRELVRSDQWLTCRMIADELDMSKETVRKILLQDLGMRKLAVKRMPRNLTEEQKDRHLTLCMDFVEQLQEDNFFGLCHH